MSEKTQLSTEYTEKKRDRKKIIAIILALAIIVASAAVGLGYTFSRYANQLDPDYHYIDATDFYFSAEYLVPSDSGSVPTYTIYNYPGNKTVTFNVYNYTDDLSINSEKITFATQTNKGSITAGGDLAGGSKKSKAITLTANGTGVYTVTVTSSSPYQQSLTANFEFVEATAPTINTTFVNYDDYVTLNVALAPHANATASVNVTWDTSLLVLDTTNDLFTTSVTNPATVNMNTGGSYQIIFYKKTPGNVVASSAVSATLING